MSYLTKYNIVLSDSDKEFLEQEARRHKVSVEEIIDRYIFRLNCDFNDTIIDILDTAKENNYRLWESHNEQ